MNAIDEAVLAVIEMMNLSLPFAKVTRGALPSGNGITCEVGPSSPYERYMDKSLDLPLDLTINGKHKKLDVLSTNLNRLFYDLTMRKTYPSGEGWSITDITVDTMPQVIGRESDNSWLMAGSLSVKLYWRGE